MEPAKKIEPGCLAMFVGPVCRVGTRGPHRVLKRHQSKIFPNEVCWLLDEINPVTGNNTNARDKDLMRIDDDDLQREIEQERELCLT